MFFKPGTFFLFLFLSLQCLAKVDTLTIPLTHPIVYHNLGGMRLPAFAMGGDVKYKKAQFRIVLLSHKNKINTKDEIAIVEYGRDSLLLGDYASTSIINEIKAIENNDEYFKVLAVDSNARWVRLITADKIDFSLTTHLFDKLPPENVKMLSSESINLSSFSDGKRYLYMVFWTTWCEGCVQEIPYLRKLQNDYHDKLMIVGINNDENVRLAQLFVESHNITWPQIQGSKLLDKLMDQNGYPDGKLFSPKGELIKKHLWFREGEIEKIITK